MVRQCHTGGMHARIREADDPAGTIVYIHGLGESGLCFERLAADDRLHRWTHIAPDLPRYGKSPWPENPLNLEELSDVLAQWLNEQGIQGSCIIGHSMGGRYWYDIVRKASKVRQKLYQRRRQCLL